MDTLFEDDLPPLPTGSKEEERPDEETPLLPRVLRGGYPEARRRSEARRRDAWFGAYVTTILQRDVRDLANIEGLTTMPRLLSLLAARTGSLLNYSEIARSSGLPQTTLKRYMTLLETTFLLQTVPAWSGNLSKRLVKSPKLMLSDTGLAAHLMGMSEDRLEANRHRLGPLLENFVSMELRKQVSWSRHRPSLFHFRTQTGREVDLVLEQRDGRLVGIEVKASRSVSTSAFRGLRALAEAQPDRFHRGVVLYGGDEPVRFGPELHALPFDVLWRW